MVNADKVNNSVRFDILEKAVKIGDIFIWGLHDFVNVITSHRNNNLLVRRIFGGHIDMIFCFTYIVNSPMNVFNLFG